MICGGMLELVCSDSVETRLKSHYFALDLCRDRRATIRLCSLFHSPKQCLRPNVPKIPTIVARQTYEHAH